jgi:hypothetical protein
MQESAAHWATEWTEGLKADLGNFHFLKYRHVDGFLVTAKNSGTHWLRYMLSCAMAAHFNKPPPEAASGDASDDFVGHPRTPGRWAGVPRIGASHNIPSKLIGAQLVRDLMPMPPAVVLVRDPKQALLSHWVKWRGEYGGDLETYLAGDPKGRRYRADIWWYLRFFNRWGAIAAAYPEATLVMRYEDLAAAPAETLDRIGRHYGMGFSADSLARGVNAGERQTMSRRMDPRDRAAVVSDAVVRGEVAFSAEQHAWIDKVLRKRLQHDFGYGYARRS